MRLLKLLDVFGIIGGFFEIKKLQQRQHELEMAYLDADLNLAKIENKIIESEPANVRPHLAREFALQRAFSRMGLSTKSTQQCIDMARLWAKKS